MLKHYLKVLSDLLSLSSFPSPHMEYQNDNTDAELSSLPTKGCFNKKSLSGFVTKISLLESELVCLLLSCSQTNCTFLWCPSKKLINYRHLTTPHYKCRAAFAIREMCSHSNLAQRLLFQQLIYFAYFFALSGSSLGYVVAGQIVCVWVGGVSYAVHIHFIHSLELSTLLALSSVQREWNHPWVGASVICVMSGAVTVCKKCFSSSAWGTVSVMLKGLQILPGLESAEETQPSAFAAPAFDTCTGLYHSPGPCSASAAKIFRSCCPLIDNTLKGLYFLERPWLAWFTAASGERTCIYVCEHVCMCVSPLRGLPRRSVGTQRWCFWQRCWCLRARQNSLEPAKTTSNKNSLSKQRYFSLERR